MFDIRIYIYIYQRIYFMDVYANDNGNNKKEWRSFFSEKDNNKKDYFRKYFRASGRHQTMVGGEIVCEYLHSCTDTKLLSYKQYFKGFFFEFVGYENLGTCSNNILERKTNFFFENSTWPTVDLFKYERYVYFT